jgi:type VI secretion system FHA domain protein
LKFLPGAEQALEAILFRPRAGFLSGSSAFTGALGDLRTHQVATLAAIQPALAKLLEDLSPDAVEAAIGSKGFLAGSRKQRAWDHFVAAWDARAHPHDNGILDAFLALFAEAYEDAVTRQQTDSGT